MTLLLGIDDAGRGPLIGPMILVGVLMNKDQERAIKKAGAADSKLLVHSERIRISKFIRENSLSEHVVKSSPEEIDNSINSGINLNTLEAMKTAEIINAINIPKYHKEAIIVIVDCPSVNITAWRNKLLGFIKHIGNLEVLCEHKADFNHPSVSAASILAKVTREEEVDKIKEKYKEYGNTGSGYPSDPFTKEFLKKNGEKLKDSGLFRKTWQTWKTMFPEKKQGQASLGDFTMSGK